MSTPRITLPVLAVLAVFLDDPTVERFGFQITQASGLAAGTVYPILQRLLAAGWLDERYESPGEHGGHQGPLRRYYRFTEKGATRAYNVIQERQAQYSSLGRVLSPRPDTADCSRGGRGRPATGGTR